MERYLLDADATLCIRSLRLFPVLRASTALPRPLIVTEYVARRELSSIDREIREMEGAGLILVKSVLRSDKDYRRLVQEGADKGEAEAIAWALSLPRAERPLFISIDHEARRFAAENRVPAGDMMDFVIDLVELGVLTIAEAEDHTSPWLDHKQQRGRPRDFTTFSESMSQRRSKRGARDG